MAFRSFHVRQFSNDENNLFSEAGEPENLQKKTLSLSRWIWVLRAATEKSSISRDVAPCRSSKVDSSPDHTRTSQKTDLFSSSSSFKLILQVALQSLTIQEHISRNNFNF